MPVNYYPNGTEAELLVLLEHLQRRQTSGQVYMTTYSGDQQVKSYQNGSRVEVEIRRVLYSLFKLNPSTYSDPYVDRIRRTRPRYVYS